MGTVRQGTSPRQITSGGGDWKRANDSEVVVLIFGHDDKPHWWSAGDRTGKTETAQCVDDRSSDRLARKALRWRGDEVELRLGFGRVLSQNNAQDPTYL
jgi:hypothetical protein